MSKLIYGCDINKHIEPIDVRDAIVRCFKQAHGEISKKSLEDSKGYFKKKELDNFIQMNVKLIVIRAFNETGGNFDNPNKQDIIAAMDYLKEFSKKFRDINIIEKHYKEVMQLVKKLK